MFQKKKKNCLVSFFNRGLLLVISRNACAEPRILHMMVCILPSSLYWFRGWREGFLILLLIVIFTWTFLLFHAIHCGFCLCEEIFYVEHKKVWSYWILIVLLFGCRNCIFKYSNDPIWTSRWPVSPTILWGGKKGYKVTVPGFILHFWIGGLLYYVTNLWVPTFRHPKDYLLCD